MTSLAVRWPGLLNVRAERPIGARMSSSDRSPDGSASLIESLPAFVSESPMAVTYVIVLVLDPVS